MKSAYSECVACSSKFDESPVILPEAKVEICESCGGHHYTVTVKAYGHIIDEMRLVEEIPNEVSRYFHITAVDGLDEYCQSVHGWIREGFGFDHVVQVG